MRPLTEADVRASIVNAEPEEIAQLGMPHDFLLIDWDYLDFLAWRDTVSSRRGCVVVQHEGHPVGILLRSTDPGRARSGMCNICHTLQPGNQVALFTARRTGARGARGDSAGTYICADLSCHENVRLAHPLAPNEVRAPGQADMRLDGTRRRMEAFVARVVGES
ncbi:MULTISPECIES: FBP domain-containing protein [Microbacterium]|uniref:FBP domain-containing protein n=1 Tax=Microbacterium TaxID=33882 RepID=UPI00217E5FB2|nr:MULTISPECIES: FBP domain-containing protein [Microbacterium]UWF77865.1 FBP domain-containing protein [Microbacterium neungamense]WCM56041.1 FBP domain-containing protein [Microbacterium sp. EF45047]